MNYKKIVFLDRDGVINIDKGHVSKEEDFEFIYAAPYAIKKLNDNGIKPFVVTNQSGIEKGLYTEDQFLSLTNYIELKLKEFNAYVEATYYCKYLEAECRKPSPGMIYSILKDYNLQQEKKFMYMIGDKLTDIQAGNRAGCYTILLNADDHFINKKIKRFDETPNVIVSNLSQAVEIIISTPLQKLKNSYSSKYCYTI